jgi:3-oxoadipate enol-lactonase
VSGAVELHHVLDGPPEGSPLVLASSLGTTHAMWEPQRAALSAAHRLIRYDHRGHGASPAPPGDYSIEQLGADAIALLDRLEISATAWCGASFGGMVGLWLAINAPARIERLVVICSSAYAPPPSRWLERAAAVRAAGSTAAVADAVLARWFTAGFAASSPQAVEPVAAMLRATPAEGYAGCCAAIASLDLREGLPRIAAPTLVISAAQDTALPPEHGRAIADAVPGARFELITQAAHLASIEQAGAVNRLISDYLAPMRPAAHSTHA